MVQLVKGLDEPDSQLRERMVVEVAYGLSANDPEIGIELARDELDGEQRINSIASMVGSWAQRNFNAAANWLSEQKASPTRAAAIASFASEVRSVNPEAARIWAEEISVPELRRRTLKLLSQPD